MRPILLSALLFAATARAQEVEIGLYPTARVHAGRRIWWPLGGGIDRHTRLPLHVVSRARSGIQRYVESGDPVTLARQSPHTARDGLARARRADHAPVVPYVSGGAGYNWFQFHLPDPAYPGLTDIRTKGFWVRHSAAGLKFKLSHNTALRAEASMDVQNHRRATAGGFVGVSFFPGAKRPAPRVERIVTTSPPIHDTTVVTRVDTVRVTVPHEVQKTVVDTSVLLVLQDVNFGFGRSDLRPLAKPVLDRASQQLNSIGNVPIQIIGYTDSVGSDSYNNRLGLARATAVQRLPREGWRGSEPDRRVEWRQDQSRRVQSHARRQSAQPTRRDPKERGRHVNSALRFAHEISHLRFRAGRCAAGTTGEGVHLGRHGGRGWCRHRRPAPADRIRVRAVPDVHDRRGGRRDPGSARRGRDRRSSSATRTATARTC